MSREEYLNLSHISPMTQWEILVSCWMKSLIKLKTLR